MAPLCILLPRKHRAITGVSHVKQTWELFNPKPAPTENGMEGSGEKVRQLEPLHRHEEAGKLSKKVTWDTVAQPRARSHHERDRGSWGNAKCWGREAFPRGQGGITLSLCSKAFPKLVSADFFSPQTSTHPQCWRKWSH